MTNNNFKEDLFLKTEFVPRVERVLLSDLEKWFEGTPEVFLRNLNAEEMIAIEEAVTALVKLNPTSNASLLKRIAQINHASDQFFSIEALKKLSEVFPIEFMELHRTIISLTARGQIEAKQNG